MSRTMKGVPRRIAEDRGNDWTGAERHRCGNNRGWQVAERYRTGNLRGGPCLVADSGDTRCQQQSDYTGFQRLGRTRVTRRELVHQLYYSGERRRVRDELHSAVRMANGGISIESIAPVEQHNRNVAEWFGF
jgi:hypothetical protein